MAIDTARDREIASKATDGPWLKEFTACDAYYVTVGGRMLARVPPNGADANENSDYIAHFNPQYIQEYIAAAEERDALRVAIKKLAAKLTTASNMTTQCRRGEAKKESLRSAAHLVRKLLSQSDQEPSGGCDE